jgi:hypothetical protein
MSFRGWYETLMDVVREGRSESSLNLWSRRPGQYNIS